MENVSLMYELSEAFTAKTLKHSCILYILEHFEKLTIKPWYMPLLSPKYDFMNFAFVFVFFLTDYCVEKIKNKKINAGAPV